MRHRRWFSAFARLLVASGAVAVVWLLVPQAWQATYCGMVLPLTTWRPGVARLLDYSNALQEQMPEFDRNLEEQPQAEQPGWRVLTPRDKTLPAKVRLKIKWERDRMVFFPRVSGPGDSVKVYQITGIDYDRRLMFTLRGDASGWSPVGGQFEVNLGCAVAPVYGQVFDVVLEIEMAGPWAQVWLKDGQIFFY
jgi:hypothetical protein